MSAGQAIGATCTGNASCIEPFPYCAMDGSDPYCTKQGCKAGECPTGYSCDAASEASFCAKLPSGIGVACTATGGECDELEANFCESFMAHVCFVEDCATGQSKCPGEYACCDLSSLVGMPRSLCFAPNQLQNGACPAGTLVTP
jgi:hypothetical protein